MTDSSKNERSVEQKLFESFSRRQGCYLTKSDVDALLFDDAVACRITNKAAAEAGVPEPGTDDVSRTQPGMTWSQFKQHLQAISDG